MSEQVKNTVLFDLLVRAHGAHWKDPFEIKIRLASPDIDPPIPKEAVRKVANELIKAIQWFHGAEISIELDTLRARPYNGEAAAYWTFDGYVLTIGSIGYQG